MEVVKEDGLHVCVGTKIKEGRKEGRKGIKEGKKEGRRKKEESCSSPVVMVFSIRFNMLSY